MSSEVQQCPACMSDTRSLDTVYFGEENKVCEYILCTVCGFLVASSTIHDDMSCQNMECEEIGLCRQSDQENENVIDVSDISCTIEEDGCSGCAGSLPNMEDFVPDPVNQQQRLLKNSYSAFNFDEQQNVVVSAAAVTLDNGDLSRDCLKRTRERYCQDFTCGCLNSGSQILPVEGMKDIFHCSKCFSVHGVDDSMNYYDLLWKGDYVVEACVSCGNDDPNHFLIEQGSTPDSVSLKCMKCCDGVPEDGMERNDNAESMDEEHLLDLELKEWIHYECKCTNSNPELQKFDLDCDSGTIFVKCWVCQREDMVAFDVKPKVCKCNTSDFVDVHFDEFGYASQLVCLKCQAKMDCGPTSDADIPAAGDGTSAGRKRISSFADIQIGDHIAWHQMLGYWHHAIVTEVNGRQIRVVHYNGPSLPNKGRIVEEWMPVDPDNDELYRVNYKLSGCHHPKDVVSRARSRVDECKYNILTNNCEHFARWCKTGHKRSMQSESFFLSMFTRAVTLLETSVVSGCKWLFKTPQGNAVLKHGANMVQNTVSADGFKLATQQAVAQEATPLLASASLAAPALIISREIQMICRDIRKAHQQRCDGHITREEFIKVTIKRVAEGSGSLAGVGITLAVPFTRNGVCYTLGAVIGHGAGIVVGRGLCCLYSRKSI